jgi:hypothetical protein
MLGFTQRIFIVLGLSMGITIGMKLGFLWWKTWPYPWHFKFPLSNWNRPTDQQNHCRIFSNLFPNDDFGSDEICGIRIEKNTQLVSSQFILLPLLLISELDSLVEWKQKYSPFYSAITGKT